MSQQILLTTLNATYQHCAFGLRYLKANLGDLRPRTKLIEFTISHSVRDVAQALLVEKPAIIGISVYIWNIRQTTELVGLLKKIAPEIVVVVGGPEVSYEAQLTPLCQMADYVIQGEGEVSFRELCEKVLIGERPLERIFSAVQPKLEEIALPYEEYLDDDIRNRFLYVEASRGCPYRCEFCLSSLDTAVRAFPLNEFLGALDRLITRGARQFKFVDRTFNLNIQTSAAILSFFLERVHLGLFLHFELVPDRLPEALRELIAKFPEGSLQFEIGIQTFDLETSKRISRIQNTSKVKDNFHFLTTRTSVHLHADLIVGLPGENLETIGRSFDLLAELNPHEIQVGILKRLKGTPIIRHDAEWEMVYEEESPYTILQTKTLSFSDLQRLVRFAKFWDLYANRGNFPKTMSLFKKRAKESVSRSLFHEFLSFSDYLSKRHPQRHGVALSNLVESAWYYLKEQEDQAVKAALIYDYCERISRDVPSFLRDEEAPVADAEKKIRLLNSRQRRHGEQTAYDRIPL